MGLRRAGQKAFGKIVGKLGGQRGRQFAHDACAAELRQAAGQVVIDADLDGRSSQQDSRYRPLGRLGLQLEMRGTFHPRIGSLVAGRTFESTASGAMIEFDPTSPDEPCGDRAKLDLEAQGQFTVSGRASERGPRQTGDQQFNVLKCRPDQIRRDR